MDYPIKPVAFTEVGIDDAFWLPRLRTNREVTIPYDFQEVRGDRADRKL